MLIHLDMIEHRLSSMVKVIGHGTGAWVHGRKTFLAMDARYEAIQRYSRLKSRPELETINK